MQLLAITKLTSSIPGIALRSVTKNILVQQIWYFWIPNSLKFMRNIHVSQSQQIRERPFEGVKKSQLCLVLTQNHQDKE